MKIAESFFVNNGDTTKVLLKYPWLEEAIYMQTPKNEYRLKNGKVERNDGVGWVVPRTEDPDYHKNLIILADLNKTSQPVNIFKYYWNKIFKNEQGGTMNYALYLQGGALLALPKVENRLGEQEVSELAQRIIQGDEEAVLILVENAINDPENAYISELLANAKEASEQGNEAAQKLWSAVAPVLQQAMQAQSLKCGGRVRAKVKKANCGKKLEKGSKVPEVKKGGCPCQWKKVGGKLIEVDCNGISVAKNGAVLYAQPGDQLPSIVDLLKDNKKQLTITKAMWSIPGYGSARNWDYDSEDYGRYFGDRFIPKTGTYSDGQVMYRDMQETNQNDPGFNYIYSSTRPADRVIRISDDGKTYSREHLAPGPYREVTTEEQLNRERNAFGAGKQGKFGGLTYDEALARQNEMQAAKAQGFNVDLGRWGADGKWGNQSRSEWERYQQWKADQELAALKAQNAGLLRIESSAALNPTRITVDNSTATAPLAVTRNGDIVRTSSLTPGQALSQLNTPAWEEYTRRLRQGILSSKNGGKISYADYLK